MTVAQIAAAVGFDSPHYLTRQFTRRYGVPPTAHRQKTRNPELELY